MLDPDHVGNAVLHQLKDFENELIGQHPLYSLHVENF